MVPVGWAFARSALLSTAATNQLIQHHDPPTERGRYETAKKGNRRQGRELCNRPAVRAAIGSAKKHLDELAFEIAMSENGLYKPFDGIAAAAGRGGTIARRSELAPEMRMVDDSP